jgi:tetratricopeptide (TPR) repeat protein
MLYFPRSAYPFSVTLALLLVGCACRPDAPAAGPATASRPDPWCETARRIALELPEALHEVERNRALADTAVVALELGADEQAAEIAQAVAGWRRGDLLARLGGQCHATGRKAAGDRFLEASEAAARESGLEAWQSSRIRLAIERARAARPDGARSDAAEVERLEPADQAALLPHLMQQTVAASNLLETLTLLESVTNQVLDLDLAAGAFDAYRVVYQKAGASGQTALYRERLLAGLETLLQSLHPAIACDKFIDFGEAAQRLGDADFVTRLRQEVDGRLGLVRADMRVPVQTRYARFLIRAGDAQRARECLLEAEALLADPALLAEERPVARARLGAAWQELGDDAASTERFTRAIEALKAIGNGRPRAVAAVQVCLVFARAGAADPALLQSMDTVRNALGDPW